MATGSRSRSPARSTACRSRAAPARISRSIIGSDTFIPGFEEQLIGIEAGETAHRQASVPGQLSRTADSPARKPSSRSPRSRSRRRATSTIDDEFAKSLGMESLDKLREARQGPASRASTRPRAAEAQAPAARRARRDAQVRSAADAGRAGVRQRLAARSRSTSKPARPHLRGRRHHRGEGARTNTAGSPSAACGSAWCSPRSARRTISR